MIYRKVLIFLSFLGLFSCLVSGKLFSEKRVLLELKRRLSDSSGILSSWNRNGSNHCSWSGISCNSKSRVVSVIIRGCRGYRGNSLSSGKVRACQGSRNGGLVGTVSPLIGKLTELRVLSLVFNEFVGEIPEAIWGLEKLEVLDLQGNNFTGKIPDMVSGLRNLRVLNLGSNQIVGEIPLSLTECKSLEVLNLGGNELKGSIPGFFGGFEKLRRLDLSYNQLSGSIPGDIGRNCRYLEHLDLSWNFLVGSIPASLGRCRRLKTLLLPSNLLHEAIGDGFGSLHKLEVLDVLRNKLGGLFPNEALKASEDSFSGHVHLKLRKLLHDYDDSGQNFTSSASDNDDDDPPIKNDLYPIEVASIVSASVIVSALIVLVVLFLYTRRSFRSSRIQVAETKEIRVFVDIGVPLTYENIVRATGNFNNSNCIGHGGFGSTYKAEISPNTLVAVKRLSVGRFQGVQQFHAEIKTLEVVRHPNLVTLIGYHASEAEMFLVYNYLPGGNLENFIRERSKRAVEWKTIHKIALDVARALEYLHDQCSPKVLHRDVKPSNILLDNNLKAYLSDFGLSKLMGSSQTHATTGVAGTFGYVAPEYAMTCRVSEKADVYSYGIVLLELISDKKALDPSFSMHENGFNIVSWAHMMLRQGQAKDVFNVALWESGPHDDLVDILHLALKCTVASLSTRPTMKQVVLQLRQIRPS